jgi:3',5'-cyclic AMP phosphodiesterase CpdA
VSDRIGIIGDVHGELSAVSELVERALSRVDLLVFVGDYVNRGRQSAEVVEYLVGLGSSAARCVFLAGNHDVAFRAALDGAFDEFLQIGGAATVRSYVGPPYADVEQQFLDAVPPTHQQFLNSLGMEFTTDELYVGHQRMARFEDGRFGVFGHSAQLDEVPTVTDSIAWIDTGCGTWSTGRLTCFFWPSRTWVQTSPRSVTA